MASRTTPAQDSLAAALSAQEYLRTRLSSASSAPTFRSIPTIDLTPSFSPLLSSRQSVAAEISTACTTVGFFFITGHGIPPAVLDDVLKLAKRFFDELSGESKEKMHLRRNRYFRGWEPSEASSVSGDGGRETKEAWNWGYESGLDLSGGDGRYVELDGEPEGNVKANMWPEEGELPGFYEGVKAYYGQVLQLSRHLFRLFALALALPESYFDAMTTHPGGIARLIRYPPALNPTPFSPDSEIGLGAHSDYECFTLLLQSAPGLEVLSPDNHWVNALPPPDALIVNVGDFLMRWTNGVYRSTVHRVVNRGSEERFSIPLFFSVNYDEVVETLPSCLGEGEESKYPPITAGRYVLDRLGLTVQEGY